MKCYLIAITIVPQNPKTEYGLGWKVEEGCEDSSEEEYIQCIEEIAYTKEDIFTDFANEELKANTFFVGWMEGLSQSLDVDKGKISNNFYLTMAISLNNSLSYQIVIMDPKIQIFSEIPQTYPITRVSLLNRFVGALQVYLKVKYEMSIYCDLNFHGMDIFAGNKA